MLKVFLIAGARPNFMKIAPIYTAMKQSSDYFEPIILHTGQHYDEKMSRIFFEDLELPRPHIYLGVGSASHAIQTAEIMKRFEQQLLQHQPHLIMVVGDVNSTVACSLTAAKIRYNSSDLTQLWTSYESYQVNRKTKYPITTSHHKMRHSHQTPVIAHVEAGLRSFDFDMPEEINRIETDMLSDLLFTTCIDGDENLVTEGVDPRKIFFIGNVMIDSLQTFVKKSSNAEILKKLDSDWKEKLDEPLKANRYILVTLHRPSNVDIPEMLIMILSALIRISKDLPVIFPMHPRTQKLMKQLDQKFLKKVHTSKIIITDPIGYLDFLCLQTGAKLVLSDSGGIQEETSYLGIPCLTLRPNTERPITMREGTNTLVALNEEAIVREAKKAIEMDQRQPANIKFWDGQAAIRIVNTLKEIFIKTI